MKVYLINPGCEIKRTVGKFLHVMKPIPPLGLAYIASVLERRGVEVKLEDQFATKISNQKLVEDIIKEKPDLIGFSCLTTTLKNVLEIICRLKNAKISSKIILGNIHSSVFHQELLSCNYADFIVHGEGEETIVELVDAIYDNKSLGEIAGVSFNVGREVVFTGFRPQIKEIDALPYPAFHLLDLSLYEGCPLMASSELTLPVIASRGCPYECFYCTQNYLQKKLIIRNTNKVIDEIEYFYNKFSIRHFGFIDAMFPFTKEQGFSFCKEFIRRGLNKKIKWFTENRPDFLDFEILEAMKEAGCRLIMYGFEVGNSSILDKTKKRALLKDSRKVMELTKKAGILTFGLFMMGLPGETQESIRETIRFSCELDCDFAKFNRAIPYPGSLFFELIRDRFSSIGDFQNSPEKFSPWYDSKIGEDLPYIPDGLTGKQLINLQKEAVRKFYLRPKLILRHLIKRNISLKTLITGAKILRQNRFN